MRCVLWELELPRAISMQFSERVSRPKYGTRPLPSRVTQLGQYNAPSTNRSSSET